MKPDKGKAISDRTTVMLRTIPWTTKSVQITLQMKRNPLRTAGISISFSEATGGRLQEGLTKGYNEIGYIPTVWWSGDH